MQRGAVVTLRLWRTVGQQLGVDQRPGVDHHLRLLQQTVAFEVISSRSPGPAPTNHTQWGSKVSAMVFFLLTGDDKNGIMGFEVVAAAQRGQR
jgi:hypothetical protein